MLARMLEHEVMDTPAESVAYDQMDHAEVNRLFVSDLLAFLVPGDKGPHGGPVEILDLGTGTARIPIEVCLRETDVRVLAVDAAASMLQVAHQNITAAGLDHRITLRHADAKCLPIQDGAWQVVISNSIVHHIPVPAEMLADAVRVTAPGGKLFFRDLLRPNEETRLTQLVETYTAGATEHQRQMFADSLRAALALEEIRELVARFGFPADSVRQTSDRHWTWAATKRGDS
jgi:ubiquinone/menaquinone biosynthesis C-methylase UbiE